MKKQLCAKIAWLCLVSMLLAVICPFSVAAEVPEEEGGLPILETAAMNGYYSHDLETGETEFVEASTYAPTPGVEYENLPSIPGDPEVMSQRHTGYFEDDVPYTGNQEPAAGIEPYGIIGNDERVPIESVTTDYASTCLLVVRYPNNAKDYGTGFLIDRYHILTAGHLLYNADNATADDEGFVDHVAVYVGSHDGEWIEYRLSSGVEVGGDFIANFDNENLRRHDDWGIVTVSDPINVTTMEIDPANSASEMQPDHFFDQNYFTHGYPLDLNQIEFGANPGLNNLVQYKIYETSGQIESDISRPRFLNLVSMTLDTYYGQSGSPVYYKTNGNSGDFIAQAIVVSGEENEDGGSGVIENNYAILINDWLYNHIADLR